MRILFIKDWNNTYDDVGGNFDGILAAVAELSKRHSVSFVTRRLHGQLDHKV